MTTVAGHLVWHRGMKGFVPSKRPAGYQPTSGEAEPVAVYPLNAEQYGMSIAILEQRFPPPRPPEESAPPPAPNPPAAVAGGAIVNPETANV